MGGAALLDKYRLGSARQVCRHRTEWLVLRWAAAASLAEDVGT
jgi:hypothetical protein